VEHKGIDLLGRSGTSSSKSNTAKGSNSGDNLILEMAMLDYKSGEKSLRIKQGEDLLRMALKMKDERRSKALNCLRRAKKMCITERMVTTKWLAKLIGILSATRTQFPLASLYLMRLHKVLTKGIQKNDSNGTVRLDPSVIAE
jgi:hypothetical protein